MHRFSALFGAPKVAELNNDDDNDENEEAKRGRSHAHRAADKRRYQPYAEKSARAKDKMASQMTNIAIMLDQRRIVPADKKEHEKLIERELSTLDTRGPASLSTFRPLSGIESMQTPGSLHLVKVKKGETAQYDLLEFADMLSQHGGAMQVENAKKSARIHKGIHTHEARQTLFASLAHVDAHARAFLDDDLFVYKLFGEGSAAFASLLSCAQHDSAEQWLEGLKLDDAALKASRTVAQWADDVLGGCGLTFFCAYVSEKDDKHVCLLFSADASNRYFLVLVAALAEDADTDTPRTSCMDLAKRWNTSAEGEYKRRINDTESARETLNPCTSRLEGSAHPYFWAVYDLSMCELFTQTKCTMQYAYYTACQCVSLS